jgi:putative transposase
MKKFKNKYRIETARAQWWNYANKGSYFITICTANRENLMGKIYNNEMHLSEIGSIVEREWNKSFEIRSELFCDTFVIMPNHLHAILQIDEIVIENIHVPVETHVSVETHGSASLHNTTPPPSKKGIAYRPPKSISSFVAGFKSAATKRINEWRNTPRMSVWQPRFHDHIIRNQTSYQQIYNYIQTNVENWKNDCFNAR